MPGLLSSREWNCEAEGAESRGAPAPLTHSVLWSCVCVMLCCARACHIKTGTFSFMFMTFMKFKCIRDIFISDAE